MMSQGFTESICLERLMRRLKPNLEVAEPISVCVLAIVHVERSSLFAIKGQSSCRIE